MAEKMTLESRGALQDFIANQAAEDADYREKLLKDPKSVLASHTGAVPDWLNVKVAEETANTIWLVAPHVPGEELGDEDLEQVSGGGYMSSGGGSGEAATTCSRNYGSFNSTVTISGGYASGSGGAGRR